MILELINSDVGVGLVLGVMNLLIAILFYFFVKDPTIAGKKDIDF